VTERTERENHSLKRPRQQFMNCSETSQKTSFLKDTLTHSFSVGENV